MAKSVKQPLLNKVLTFKDVAQMNALFAQHWVENLALATLKLGLKIIARENWIRLESESETTLLRGYDFFVLAKAFVCEQGRALTQEEFELMLTRAFQIECASDFFQARVRVSPRKKDVLPKNNAQYLYLKQLREKEVVFGLGPAGTGKTYLAMAMAVSDLLSGRVKRLILTRPAREAGENLGFLPGTLEEKIMPYLRPLYDALYDMMEIEELTQLTEKKVIEIAPLAFMRGRTLNDAFIILDEAQNATPDQLLMFLTRLGFNSKCVVTGDPTQSDLPLSMSSALLHAQRQFVKISEIGFSFFTTQDVVRHRLVEKIINAWKDKPHEI